MKTRFTIFLLAALATGCLAGLLCRETLQDPATLGAAVDGLQLPATIFLNLVKMVIAPLVLSTIVTGIAGLGSASNFGRIGLTTILCFFAMSLFSLLIGIAMALWLQPGSGISLPHEEIAAVAAQGLTFTRFATGLFPESVFDALARNNMLQIVVFSGFAGAGMIAAGERAKPLLEILGATSDVMFKIAGLVMWFAPLAVFGAAASAVARQGAAIFLAYGTLIASFYLALSILWLCLFLAAWLLLRRQSFALLAAIKDPALIAFSTSSSEVAFPRSLEALEQFGVPNELASFILALGYSFNLCGSMVYCSFAVLFLAQAYGVPFDAGQLALLTGLLFVTGKGTAGVPRGSLVMIAAVLPHFHLPAEAIAVVLAVDQFMDMGRSGTNVVGNAIAAAAIARLEGVLPVRN